MKIIRDYITKFSVEIKDKNTLMLLADERMGLQLITEGYLVQYLLYIIGYYEEIIKKNDR